jgi:hypothetical protein
VKTTYVDETTRTICDLSAEALPDGTESFCVQRINTPKQVRGRRAASRLMRERVLTQADVERATLHLWIGPGGGLDYSELAAWYHRLGFRPRKFGVVELWVRMPIDQG